MTASIISLIIFAICVALFIWNKLPTAVVAVLGLLAMVLTNCVSFKDGFKNFSDYIIVLICAMMVVGQATFDSGLATVVGRKVVKLARGNERMIVILSTAITLVLSAFLSNIASLAIMLSILTGICAANEDIKFMNVVMPVSMAAVIGGSITLVGSTPQLTAQNLLKEATGETFKFSTFLIPAGIVGLLLVFWSGFIGYPLGKKIWGNRPEYNEAPNHENAKELPTPDKKKMRIMAVIVVVTILMFIFNDDIALIIPQFNLGIASLISATLCVITGCISHKDAIKSINWNLGLWFCSTLGIATALAKSGGGALLANTFIDLFGKDAAPLVLFGAFVALTVILTQFLANSTVITIVLPVVFPILGELGLNYYGYAVGIAIAGAMAVATPLANSTIGMSMVAKYKFSDYFKYAGPITLMAIAVIVAIVPVLYPLQSKADAAASEASAEVSGNAGDEVRYKLENGVLTISGKGKMDDYALNSGKKAPYLKEDAEIKSVVIEDGVTSIGAFAFADASTIESVTIPASVKTIGKQAFSYCTSLSEIKIPSGVKKIDESLFDGCSSLKTVEIPDSVMSVAVNAFSGTAIYKDKANWSEGVLYIGKFLIKADSKSEDLPKEYKVKTGTLVIADKAFFGCDKLESVDIPDGVVTIGESAFSGCKALEIATIADSVKTVGKSAFSGASYLNIYCDPGTVDEKSAARKYADDNTVKNNVSSNTATVILAIMVVLCGICFAIAATLKKNKKA